MNWSKSREFLKLALIGLWLVFTIAFALWWFKFSLENIALLSQLDPGQLEHWQRQHRMVLWEGGSWLVLLILGGLALTFLVQRERWRMNRIREFFASFSHEIKTSLASLRVQVESLQDDGLESPLLDRLVADTVRLALQLENSLFLSSDTDLKLYIQNVRLVDLVQRLREQWPGLDIQFDKPCVLRGDERALRTIFSNLIQNARVHGEAKSVQLKVESLHSNRIQIDVRDDGRGLKSEKRAKLGTLFHRPTATSGSGLGLFISRRLLQMMKGDLQFLDSSAGFTVCLTLEGGLEA